MRQLSFSTILIFSILLVSCVSQNFELSKSNAENSEISLTFDISKCIKDETEEIKTFSEETAVQIAAKMNPGWNLGNTLDADSANSLLSETSWGQPLTTQKMISGLAESGIKTIRIPVTWSNHIIDKNYTIDPLWMTRVKQIVDWAIQAKLYVIINTHHDNAGRARSIPYASGYYPDSKNYNESARFLKNVWVQICLAFNNSYDEHLIFETMNEPRLKGTVYEWKFNENAPVCIDSAKTLNKLNQIILDTIRSTGGNNQKRLVSVPALQADSEIACTPLFKLPSDSMPNRLILSVHLYTPYNFASDPKGTETYNPEMSVQNATIFATLNKKFIKNGCAVIVSEYGAINKSNISHRVAWFQDFQNQANQYKIPCCLWDNANPATFGYYNRLSQTWYTPEILKTLQKQ